jgi:hypothetical protein
VLTITTFPPTGAAVDEHYHAVRTFSDWGLRVWLHHLPAVKQESYLVDLNDTQPTCSCPGFSYHHRCKHLDALLCLQKAGKLDELARSKEGGAA